MSGYFGVVRIDGEAVDRNLLDRIAAELAFRGPAGTSVWSNEVCGGCAALMDTYSAPQAQQQPVILGERYFLWGDVRLDGRSELLAELGEREPAPDLDETSERLLLRAWSHWGEQALEHVIGDFSFALWDARQATLVCARDFIGPRPLYYSLTGGALFFGNTLKVFRSVPEISRELDEQFIADFLVEGGSSDSARTAFRDVRRLPPGHLLKFSKSGIEVRRFRKLPVEEPLEFAREGDYVDAYLEVVRKAVSDRLPNGAAALYLSGGLDSGQISAVAAEVAAIRGRKDELKSFTLSWEPILDDPEPRFAALTARHLGISHQVLTEPELGLLGDSSDWQAPEPDQDYFFARGRKQSQKIAQYSNVVLGGDGGDDILTGQSWPYLVHLWRTRAWKRIARDFGGYLWSSHRVPPLRAGLRAKITKFLHSEDKFAGYPVWLNPEFEARLDTRDRWLERFNAPAVDEHPLHPQAYRALHQDYWAGVLETEDAGWNGVLLETRAPLLDLRVLRFMLRLPPVPWCVDKELSRRAMRGRLPDAVVHRPKTPLIDDPLCHCTLPVGWPDEVPSSVRRRLETFVNWDKWCETLSGTKGSLSWLGLRPISLSYWLKAVENQMGIE